MWYQEMLFCPSFSYSLLHEICQTFDAFSKVLFWTLSQYSSPPGDIIILWTVLSTLLMQQTLESFILAKLGQN
jgi:hypothetical protein